MGWVKLKLRDRDSKKNRARHTEVASKRLSQVFSSNYGIGDANPQEVEAHIRDISHGMNRHSG